MCVYCFQTANNILVFFEVCKSHWDSNLIKYDWSDVWWSSHVCHCCHFCVVERINFAKAGHRDSDVTGAGPEELDKSLSVLHLLHPSVGCFLLSLHFQSQNELRWMKCVEEDSGAQSGGREWGELERARAGLTWEWRRGRQSAGARGTGRGPRGWPASPSRGWWGRGTCPRSTLRCRSDRTRRTEIWTWGRRWLVSRSSKGTQ